MTGIEFLQEIKKLGMSQGIYSSIFRCKDCGLISRDDEIVLTVNSDSEWVLHCPRCNSELLELAVEISRQSPHSLKTYYELEEEYDNEKQ